MSDDPVTPLVQAAVQMHELYGAYVAGGFTQTQALYILGVALGELMKGASDR